MKNGSDMTNTVDEAQDLLAAVAPTPDDPEPFSSAPVDPEQATPVTPTDVVKPKRVPKRRRGRAKTRAKTVRATQKRTTRPFPASTFEEALELPQAIQRIGGDEKVRRLTLFEHLDKSPESSASRQMITNSSRYGLTTGSYQAEWLELTQLGRQATSSDVPERERLSARFQLAIERVEPFKLLYERLRDRRVPTHAVMRDILSEGGYATDQLQACVDTFIVNAKFLGLLRAIAGSERLVSVEQLRDELPASAPGHTAGVAASEFGRSSEDEVEPTAEVGDWSRVCFYIAPIGELESDPRKHSDLILASLVEPAIADIGLTVVRADGIEKPGMITKQIIEHVANARLVVADLSFHNPNVFYELALRHATGKPTIHLIRSEDRIPFDIGQFRTIRVDTTGLYAFVPQIETYRAEIATHARRALEEEGTPAGPLSVFYPGFGSRLLDAA